MANIKDKLVQIRKAIFGRDVRESIASGIEEINKEVENTTKKQELLETEFDQLIINSGNSNAEIVQARVGKDGDYYSSLKERLDKENSNTKIKLDKVNVSLEHINRKQKVSIIDFGAVGDGVTNDYQAFVAACKAVGANGVLYFPKTTANKYFFNNGETGTGMRISMEGKPIFEFENPNTILRYEYAPDLKFLRTKTPFILSNHWETITRKIDTNFIEYKIQKVGSQKKNSNQKLSKLSFVNDFKLENYNGTSWSPNTTNVKTKNELTFTGGSGYCLATKKIDVDEYIEMLFVRNSVVATSGHYDITVTTNVGTYAIQFNAIVKAISVGKFVSGQYISIVASMPINEQCFLKNNGSVLFGINRVSDYAFDIVANGVLLYRLIVVDGETVSKVGFGHTSSNNINTTMKYPITSIDYVNMNYQTRKLFSFGDSITFGAYSFKDYPSIIGDMLYQEKGFKSLNVYNYGVSGDNSKQCLARINAHLGEITRGDIVTVLIGTNDCQGKQTLETFKSNLNAIIDKLRENTNLIVMASFPLYDKTMTNYENIGAYNSIIKQVCIEKGVLFVDNNANFGWNIDLLPDKIHPNEEGGLILAKGFVDGIYNLVNL
ncbi:MAG: GDSL-type esterase/lipase family protein [Clostridium septicum]|uniref:SGNH/GDSL hydrolase family protein n=1 Tax=Clostridium septicum TaxID=1504 RepID=UPI00258E8186|nr:GDSL-type esterase/lipase family protein [Clostridium septicum]MDU1313949.1 GDSL-type esterase/lipase family protein [Clostridium septicum]